jgi:hypothetical protein
MSSDMMTTTASSSSNIRARSTYSCTRCAGRKVRCDRQKPCSACVKHDADCHYPPSHPPRRRRKRIKVQTLTDRLKHYEVLLQERGIDPNNLPDLSGFDLHSRWSHSVAIQPEESQLPTPSSITSEPNRSTRNAQSPYSKTRFNFVEKYVSSKITYFRANHVNSSLWTRVIEEVNIAC